MSKTLVGLYDTLAEAEHVVEDLVQHGFSHSDVRLTTHDSTGRHTTATATATRAEPLEDENGLFEDLTDLGVPMDEARTYTEGVRQGKALVIAEADDTMAERGLEIMRRPHVADSQARDLLHEEGRAHVAPYAATQTTASGRQEHADRGRRRTEQETATMPVVEEELSVDKRQVERGKVRLRSHVEERPVEESVRLHEEKVVVERQPVNRPATDADLQAAQDQTIEMTETAEEAVISKRPRVVEEVKVHKEARERTETVRETVRRQEVEVEGAEGVQTGAARGFESYAADFRQHHATAFAGRGTYYEEYAPAYRFGYDLGTQERYRGRDWAALEADARRDWEARQPGTWERFKNAIRYGWDKIRART